MAFFTPKFALQQAPPAAAPNTVGPILDGPSRINGAFAQKLASRGSNGLMARVNQNNAPTTLTPTATNGKKASGTPGSTDTTTTTGSPSETEVPDYIQAQMAFFFKNQGSFKLPTPDPWEDD